MIDGVKLVGDVEVDYAEEDHVKEGHVEVDHMEVKMRKLVDMWGTHEARGQRRIECFSGVPNLS